jgi:hypothetical protein
MVSRRRIDRLTSVGYVVWVGGLEMMVAWRESEFFLSWLGMFCLRRFSTTGYEEVKKDLVQKNEKTKRHPDV